jgi:glutamine amidotransferase
MSRPQAMKAPTADAQRPDPRTGLRRRGAERLSCGEHDHHRAGEAHQHGHETGHQGGQGHIGEESFHAASIAKASGACGWPRSADTVAAMCRFIAYLGEPVFLDELVCRPAHSLLHQSQQAERAKTSTNGDGFGIGWYGERGEPGVYREVMPAWSDENLLALARTLKSRLFFAHVRAATGTAIARQNSHPFRHGPWLFMHNGQIGGYAGVRRTLESRLPDHLYAARKGATDSELLFLLALARIERGLGVHDAVRATLEETVALMRGQEIVEPLRFSAALSDGQRLHVFRWASDDRPPTLYVHESEQGIIVASEPLTDDEHEWRALAHGEFLTRSLSKRRAAEMVDA